MALFESIMLTFHVLLIVLGVLIVSFILGVSARTGLYRSTQIHRTVMQPMLFVGLFIALQGITELIEPYVGEVGHVAHAATMFLGAVFFLYGIYRYHQIVKKAL